jgi:hypothetical protein
MEELLLLLERREKEKETPDDQFTLVIKGSQVTATCPEGKSASMPLQAFLEQMVPRRMDTAGVVLPDGVKAIFSQGNTSVWVYQCLPSLYSLQWIASDSPAPFGREAKYRTVRIALPYVIILAVFAAPRAGILQLTHSNECFFRSAPLKSCEDHLFYPALLNCSRFKPPEGRPLSWICTQHLHPKPALERDGAKALTASFESLRHCLFETAFNYSSEQHEFSSWFTESNKVDQRISTIEAWEAASAADRLFVFDVPWLPTNHTVRQVVDRIFVNQRAGSGTPRLAASLARIVFNHAQGST